MKVLLVGSGGREHALAWKLSQSERCDALYCAPGNPGMAQHGECVAIGVEEIDRLVRFAQNEAIDLVVVGPEVPLVLGIADRLAEAGIKVFGPTAAAAQLEGSKGFTKDFCSKYAIPTARYGRFVDFDAAATFIRTTGAPIVIKADGLAAGKGVIIAQSEDEALAAARDMLGGNSFGAAGASIVIEEFLDGEELSFFALCDGKTVLPFTSAQDHKRVGDGDTGPNTGGMGAYSPAHLLTNNLQQKIMDRIILPTAQGMAADGNPFQGVLFAGIMVVEGEPFLIEYNARFGDPECQAMMLRLKDDLLEILYACASGELSRHNGGLNFSDEHALGVVIAAKGYPGDYAKGGVINLEKAESLHGVKIFQAGTTMRDSELVSTGGRVLCVTAIATDIGKAQQKAYQAVDLIQFPEGFCRRDIGWRAVAA